MGSTDGKAVVLITGCSSGIGLELAARMAQDPNKRYTVIATMRSLEKRGVLQEAAGAALGSSLLVQQLDVCSDDSVRDCLAAVPGGRVDVLVNNAGVGLIGPVEGQTMEAIKAVFDTNFFGVVRMIKAVLPDMKRRRSGHIVVISSVMGLQAVVFNDVYAASKFAVEGFCEALAMQLAKFDIHVTLVEPGPVHTKFETKLMADAAREEFAGVDAETLRLFRDVYLPASRDIFRTLGQTPSDVVKAVMRVIGKERPPFRYQTNPLYTPLTALRQADDTGQLSVQTFYQLLFRHGAVFRASLAALRCLTCSCCRATHSDA
ncbi:retinol dehydrogenase 8-like [Lethenteron reissneri]|uniref:retinol dehydrogenase 8-like n=1 Tax=Lethenteron reissneri TaxID=7753 RepID=UPI002AB6C4C2|nr:retinol dehydrogenase 8-like [Lethenteron reissneri]